MDAKEKWDEIVGFFIGPFTETAKLAKTTHEKRHVVLAIVNAMDVAYPDRAKKMSDDPKKPSLEACFEAIRRFALGKVPLSTLHGAGKRALAERGDFAKSQKIYSFATAAHRLATLAVEPDESADGGFSIRVDELPLILGFLTHCRPSQDARWEENIADALVSALANAA